MVRYAGLLGLILLFLIAPTRPARAQVEIGTSLYLGSRYVTRGEILSAGIVFQPEITASYRHFSLSFFGNVDTKSATAGDRVHLNEAELIASYDVSAGGATFGAGYIFYVFPEPSTGKILLNPSHEVFGSVAFEALSFRQDVIAYYDIDMYKGLFLAGTLGKEMPVAGYPFLFGATVGVDSGYLLAGSTQVSHVALTAGTDLTAGKLTFSPLFGFQIGVAERYIARFGKTFFYGGVELGF